MGICATVNCSNKSNKAKNIVLYRLPKDKTIQKQRLANLKRENIPTEVQVCSMYFEESCFKRDLEVICFSIQVFLLFLTLNIASNSKINVSISSMSSWANRS